MVRPASKIIFLGFGASIWIEDNVGAGLGSPRPVPWICHPGLNRPLRKNTIIFSNYRFGRASSAKCRLFSQAKLQVNLTSTLPFVLCTNCTCNGRFARFFSISSLRLKKSLVCQKQIPLTSIQVRTFARFYLRDHGCWYLHCGVRNRPRCGNFFFTYYNYYLYNTCWF